ncbi:MAG TPA: MASE4 domain-containing protein, partial [Stellaceae bacterium]|nr:MASE4 domain-containing protein [Stellaceae bacterium]
MTADIEADRIGLVAGDLLEPASVASGLAVRRRLLLSNAAVQPAERSSVLIALIVSIVILAALAPFATVMLPAVPASIPAYETALLIIDLIAAVLMFGQFAQLRTAPVLALACGYLFDALMTMAHALTFPGLFAP